MTRPATTLLEVCIAGAGLRRGMAAATFVVQWSIAVADEGELGQDGGVHAAVKQYIAYWAVSERTAYRHLDAFRQAFPGHETPAAIAEQLAPQYSDLVGKLHELQARKRAAALGPALATGLTASLAT